MKYSTDDNCEKSLILVTLADCLRLRNQDHRQLFHHEFLSVQRVACAVRENELKWLNATTLLQIRRDRRFEADSRFTVP